VTDSDPGEDDAEGKEDPEGLAAPRSRGAAFAKGLFGLDRYSWTVSPEPPISFGTSFIFGRPSFTRSTVSW
jgi:hypothetical protein